MLSLEPSTFENSQHNSVLASLAYLCKNHWRELKTCKMSPWFFSTQQNISERQVQWVILTSRAEMKSWDDIEAHFLTKVF